jgi:hypothetical protein
MCLPPVNIFSILKVVIYWVINSQECGKRQIVEKIIDLTQNV